MNATPTFAILVIGATSFRQTTKFVCAIGAMPFTVVRAMKWINATIAAKLFAHRVLHFCHVNFAGGDFAKNVLPLADGKLVS